METSLEILGPTARALRVTLPQRRFVERVESRLLHLSRTLRLNGFRPGKVPVRVVRQSHLPQVYGEALESLAGESLREALAEKNLRPVLEPEVEVEEYGEDRPMRYQARFDVYPELSESRLSLSDVALIEPGIALEDAEVEEAMERLRRDLASREAVDRPAAWGDHVEFQYQSCGMDETLGEIDENVPAKALILEPGGALSLHKHLQGMVKGEEKLVELEDGAAAPPSERHQIRLRILAVREVVLLDWDDPKLRARFGERLTREDIRKTVRAHLQGKRDEARRAYLCGQIVEALTTDEDPAVPVPDSLHEWCLSRQFEMMGVSPDDHDLAAVRLARMSARAESRRVTVFHVLRSLSGVEPSEEDERRVEDAYIARFKDPAAARRATRDDPTLHAHFREDATWDALIRWTLDRARVREESMTLEELLARGGGGG